MNRLFGIRRFPIVLLAVIVTAGLLAGACSDSSTGSDDSSNGPSGSFQVEGSVDNYSEGEQELYQKEDFVDLIEGTIGSDGSFTVTFLGEDEIEDALKTLGDDSSDDFVGMYCRDEVSQNVDSSTRFVDVNVFTFTYGEDTNVAWIGLSSDSPNQNVYPPQSDNDGDYHVRWIYATAEVSVDLTCNPSSGGTATVDLQLSEGWNEVYFDVSDRDAKVQYTGDRPGEVDWVMDE